MSGVPPDLPRDGELLSAAVKAVRKHRGMTTAEVASAMNMALRTYERFESGATREGRIANEVGQLGANREK